MQLEFHRQGADVLTERRRASMALPQEAGASALAARDSLGARIGRAFAANSERTGRATVRPSFPRGLPFLKRMLLRMALNRLSRASLLLLGCLMASPALAAGEPAPAAALERRFDVEAATTAYLNQLSPEARARSDAYFEGGYALQLVDTLFTVGIMLFLLQTGLSRRLRDWTERRTTRRWLQTALYWPGYFAATTLLTFPLAVYEGFFREHAYGLSNQTFGAWLADQGKGFLVSVILGMAMVTALYAIVRRLPNTWWLWGAFVTVGFAAFLALVFPVFIAPIFNTYTRLDDEKVRGPILRMAAANGLTASDVWVSDASRQSKRVGANVSGLLGTERITLNDNLLHRASLPEVKAVMGHELGHYVLNHAYSSLAYLALVTLAVFAALQFLLRWALNTWGARWGIRDVADPAGLPLVVLLGSILLLFLTPVFNTLVRVQEQEADMFGLNAAREPDGFAQAALQLSEYRKISPGPVEEFIFFDHPSGRTRIHNAMQWKAEQPPP
jgi:STE24 endopeptidase